MIINQVTGLSLSGNQECQSRGQHSLRNADCTCPLFHRWQQSTSMEVAKLNFWAKNTDVIRSMLVDAENDRTPYFGDGAVFYLLQEIYHSVLYLELDEYWWDWAKGHYPKITDKVIDVHRQGKPGWYYKLSLGFDFFYP